MNKFSDMKINLRELFFKNILTDSFSIHRDVIVPYISKESILRLRCLKFGLFALARY